MGAAQSVVDSFIAPAEAAGVTVDVFLQQTTCEGNKAYLNRLLVAAYGDRVRAQSYTPPDTAQVSHCPSTVFTHTPCQR